MYELESILNDCNFKIFDVEFDYVINVSGNGYLFQVKAFITCTEKGEKCWQKGGKHYISKHAHRSEVVNKFWKACQDFVMHEMREGFTYRGEMIYQPHWDVDGLYEACKSIEIARRAPDYNGMLYELRCWDRDGKRYNESDVRQLAHIYNTPVPHFHAHGGWQFPEKVT